MTDLQTAGGWATIGLGASQVLVPQTTARVFGLDELDGQARWLARLLGTANVALGAIALDPDLREKTRTITYGVLAGNAAVTLGGATSGSLRKRTAVMVLAFLGALVAADVMAE
jgi:hypothetical protein